MRIVTVLLIALSLAVLPGCSEVSPTPARQPARGGGAKPPTAQGAAQPSVSPLAAAKPANAEVAPTAAFEKHLVGLRRKLPAGFNIAVQPPFVVVGNETPARVRQRAVSTVKWAVDQLKSSYFDTDPSVIIDVWLFKDKKSYRYYAKKLFGEDPGTPYGYYSSRHRAMVMNIATGGGTLVHEIVHPFVEANFPDCPAWFNEGLGSLYEQSAERAGRIVGLTNWRLAGLQRALVRGPIPSFKALTSTSSYAFYEEDPGTNYAQARYLL